MSGDSHVHQGVTDSGEYAHWFRILDVLVWLSVAVIFAIGIEWMVGYVVREKIARGADRYLAKVAPKRD